MGNFPNPDFSKCPIRVPLTRNISLSYSLSLARSLNLHNHSKHASFKNRQKSHTLMTIHSLIARDNDGSGSECQGTRVAMAMAMAWWFEIDACSGCIEFELKIDGGGGGNN